MTAEIGILNTTGVALAADSAVTIGSSKVFNSADKLFSLSKHHPVGIMIYGNASFMGVPWETIIKIYRKKLGKTTYETLQEYSDDFFNFLKTEPRFYDKDYERVLVHRKFYQFIDELLDTINITIPEIWKVDPSEQQIIQMIYGEVVYFSERFKMAQTVPGFDESYLSQFDENFRKDIDEIVHSRINLEIDEEILSLFTTIAAYLVMKNIYMGETGVVISGYGDIEIFPVLKSYSVEGIFNGVLKYKGEHDVKIDAVKTRATVVPFAQQEMVHSFMTGIDPDLKKEVVALIEKITLVYPSAINEHVFPLEPQQTDVLRQFGKAILKQFTDSIDGMISQQYSGPVIDTVASFPKEELAAMAEALVNLTSIKRKMSFQTETVGGPIDVAVISKGDGFIWIKRKHYFKPELNHSYFETYMER